MMNFEVKSGEMNFRILHETDKAKRFHPSTFEIRYSKFIIYIFFGKMVTVSEFLFYLELDLG